MMIGFMAAAAAGCHSLPQAPEPLQASAPLDLRGGAALRGPSAPRLGADYLVRPDTGERRILRQLLHELQLSRSLIDDAYAHRDEHARVRVDYVRLSAEFNQVIAGLQQTLAATETAPRGPDAIQGEYRLYE